MPLAELPVNKVSTHCSALSNDSFVISFDRAEQNVDEVGLNALVALYA